MTLQFDINMLNFLFIITKELLVQILGVGDVIKDEDVIIIILIILTKSYKNFMQRVSIQFFYELCLVVVHVVARTQQKGLCGDHTKIEEALLLKFKQIFKKNKGKNIKHLKKFHNCNKLDHWDNNCTYFKKSYLKVLEK